MNDKMLACILGLIIISVPIFLAVNNNRGLSRHLIYSHTVVKDIGFHYKDVGIRFTYLFDCGGNQQMFRMAFLSCGLSKLRALRKQFKNKELPMIFDSTDCSNSMLVFSRQLVKKFNLEKKLSPEDRMLINEVDSICEN